MRIVFLSSEIVPYSKTGGLADVAGALPKALNKLDCDISVITPLYSREGKRSGDLVSDEQGQVLFRHISVPFLGKNWSIDIHAIRHDGVAIYFIDSPEYFGHGPIYEGGGRDAERFAFFSRASLEVIKFIGRAPDVIHCHDWQTGFVPAYLKSTLQYDSFFSSTSTLFTIHNLAYQGKFEPSRLYEFGFSQDVYNRGMEFHRSANAMKAGIYFSDAVTTVSPKYSKEIQTHEFGEGLDDLLKKRNGSLYGILNGVDYDEWNPETDKYLAENYSLTNLSGKLACKKDLLEQYQLPINIDKPVAAIVTRLAPQKGIDLTLAIIERILETGMYFILLGSGPDEYQARFQQLRNSYPDQVGVYFGYNETLAHKIEAGADIFLMPSMFEPCGLNQMYSLKYGTVPIVRGVGGLDDTVVNFDRMSGHGNGFKFYDYSADTFIEKFYEAIFAYHDRNLWARIQSNGMASDFSWDRAAREYLQIYQHIK